VESGKWKVESGKWKAESGKWKVGVVWGVGGKWESGKRESGIREMGYEKWEVGDMVQQNKDRRRSDRWSGRGVEVVKGDECGGE